MKIIEQIKALFTDHRVAKFKLDRSIVAELLVEFDELEHHLKMEASRNNLHFGRMNTYRSMLEESEKVNAKLSAELREESSKYELLKTQFQDLAKSFDRVYFEKEQLADRVQAMSLAQFKSLSQPKPIAWPPADEWQSLQTAPRDGTPFELKLENGDLLNARFLVTQSGIETFSALQALYQGRYRTYFLTCPVVGWRHYAEKTSS